MTFDAKACSRCGETKPLKEYQRNQATKDGRAYYCKVCEKERSRAYYEANRDAILARNRAWREENRERDLEAKRRRYQRDRTAVAKRGRENRLRREYGMTESDYQALIGAQDGACAICGASPSSTLHIDHDHATGEVRGLLCSNCNRGIGHLKESPRILSSAIRYLLRA